MAAAAGDQIGYLIGWHAGSRVFRHPQSRLFAPSHARRAALLVERHGPRAVVFARFVPIARTFVPVVAGVGKMPYRVFLTLNLLGAAGWTVNMITAGYYFSGIPFVATHLEVLALGLVAASVLPLVGSGSRQPVVTTARPPLPEPGDRTELGQSQKPSLSATAQARSCIVRT